MAGKMADFTPRRPTANQFHTDPRTGTEAANLKAFRVDAEREGRGGCHLGSLKRSNDKGGKRLAAKLPLKPKITKRRRLWTFPLADGWLAGAIAREKCAAPPLL